MSLRLLRVLNRVSFTWASLLSLLWLEAPKYNCDGTWVQVVAMRSDLRFLHEAQEKYHAVHGRYALTLDAVRSVTKLYNSMGVHITIDHASETTWSAHATNERWTQWTCTMNPTLDFADCQRQKTWAERNLPKPRFGNVVIDFWLVWLTLLRRQRRAAIAMAWPESLRAGGTRPLPAYRTASSTWLLRTRTP